MFREDAVRQNPSISLKTKRLILPFGLLLGTAFLSGLAWADTASPLRGRNAAGPAPVPEPSTLLFSGLSCLIFAGTYVAYGRADKKGKS